MAQDTHPSIHDYTLAIDRVRQHFIRSHFAHDVHPCAQLYGTHGGALSGKGTREAPTEDESMPWTLDGDRDARITAIICPRVCYRIARYAEFPRKSDADRIREESAMQRWDMLDAAERSVQAVRRHYRRRSPRHAPLNHRDRAHTGRDPH